MENVAGAESVVANEIDVALTKSNPVGNGTPSSFKDIERSSTGTLDGTLPAPMSSRSPFAPVIEPPPLPTRGTSWTASSGARISTVLTPFSSVSGSKISDGLTGKPAAITGEGPPGV